MLQPLDSGAFTAVTSEITLVETSVGPRKRGDSKAEQELRFVSDSFCKVDAGAGHPIVLERVIDLRSQFALKILDAIHLATGILSGCDLFVTADQPWNRAGVAVVDPADIA